MAKKNRVNVLIKRMRERMKGLIDGDTNRPAWTSSDETGQLMSWNKRHTPKRHGVNTNSLVLKTLKGKKDER